jgi:hypothetical protein
MKQRIQPLGSVSQVDGQAILGRARPAGRQGALGCLGDPSWVGLLSLNQPPTVPEVHQLAGSNNAMRLTSDNLSLQSP